MLFILYFTYVYLKQYVDSNLQLYHLIFSYQKLIVTMMDLFAKHRRRIVELSALTLFICMLSRRIPLTHSSPVLVRDDTVSSSDNNASYLYNSVDSLPILEHGRLPEIDFTASKAPKVVEFYNPKCGACRGKLAVFIM